MTARGIRAVLPMFVALPATVAAGARAQDATTPPERRWGAGVEATTLGLPRGHLGLYANRGKAITPVLVARYQLSRFTAIGAGFGLPHPSLGVGGWVAWELCGAVVSNAPRTFALSLFQQSGLQLGYAGPDYYARHGGDFVGYEYAIGGPLAFALRFPVGLNLSWASGYLDSYVAAVPIVALTPDAEVLYDVTVGTRFRF